MCVRASVQILLLLVAVGYVTSATRQSLRLVNLIYRHGDRSPYKNYPNNPNLINETWPQGLGWLTTLGMEQQYSLGRFLRRRYDGFLSQRYINTEINVTSSHVPRALMSAYSNLAGLYPPQGNQVWNRNIHWQPIPVYTIPKDEDNMVSLHAPCPRFQHLYNLSFKSRQVLTLALQNRDLLQFLATKTGIPVYHTVDLMRTADVFFCEKAHNVTWPSWMNETILDKLVTLNTIGYDLYLHTQEQKRLQGGPLLKEWERLTQKKIDDATYATKMNMYSGHDTSVVAAMQAAGVFNHIFPVYTTTVIMELHESPVGYYHVELYLKNQTSTDPNMDTPVYPLTVPGCTFKCPFATFKTLTKGVIPLDWKKECQATSVVPIG